MTKEKVEPTEDFKQELARLQNDITKVRTEYEAILNQIMQAENAKEQGKAQYNSCLDTGDEDGMKKCLQTIRESNAAMETLRGQLPVFLSRAADLRNQQSELVNGAQAEKVKSETVLQEAAASLQAADLRVTQVSGLLSQLNRLDSFLRGEREISM